MTYLKNTVSVVPVDDSDIHRDNIWEVVPFFQICAHRRMWEGKDRELKKLELYFYFCYNTSLRCWPNPFPSLGLSFSFCPVMRRWGPSNLGIHDLLDHLIPLQLSQVCLSKQATSAHLIRPLILISNEYAKDWQWHILKIVLMHSWQRTCWALTNYTNRDDEECIKY